MIFSQKLLRIGNFEKCFFESAILIFFSEFFFSLFSHETSQCLEVSKDGSQRTNAPSPFDQAKGDNTF